MERPLLLSAACAPETAPDACGAAECVEPPETAPVTLPTPAPPLLLPRAAMPPVTALAKPPKATAAAAASAPWRGAGGPIRNRFTFRPSPETAPASATSEALRGCGGPIEPLTIPSPPADGRLSRLDRPALLLSAEP